MIEIEGKNGVKVVVIKDSISKNGIRMTTFEFYFHRWILAELNTHRAIAKNLQSSRAIPLSKAMAMVEEQPAYPVHWGKNQPGMQAKEELSASSIKTAKSVWDGLKESTFVALKKLNELGGHKQWVARLLEPFVMTKGVFSGTDWDNLLWLRNDEEAQPEFGELAALIQKAFDQSTPILLNPGDWHLPYVDTNAAMQYVDSDGEQLTLDLAKKISASCCAQVSYRRLNDSREKALEIYDKLFISKKLHLSPTEHQATPIKLDSVGNRSYFGSDWDVGITHRNRVGLLHSGNLSGWIQYRQTLPNNVHVNQEIVFE